MSSLFLLLRKWQAVFFSLICSNFLQSFMRKNAPRMRRQANYADPHHRNLSDALLHSLTVDVYSRNIISSSTNQPTQLNFLTKFTRCMVFNYKIKFNTFCVFLLQLQAKYHFMYCRTYYKVSEFLLLLLSFVFGQK